MVLGKIGQYTVIYSVHAQEGHYRQALKVTAYFNLQVIVIVELN